MVKLVLFILLAMTSLYADPIVEAFIDSDSGVAQLPIAGKLAITHSSNETIDSQSFKLNEQPFSLTLVQDVAMASDATIKIAIYRFKLPAQPKGLYVLPAIQVKINDQMYQSTPLAYEVKEAHSSLAAPKSSPPAKKTVQSIKPKQTISSNKTTGTATSFIFRLEAEVKGPAVLYPGQRTQLVYRILYNENLDLTESELPFVHAANFIKIGDVHVEDRQEGETTVQELTQEVEASTVGTFSLGPSYIEGYVYQLNSFDQKVYDPNLLRAEVPVLTLEVKPFPLPSPSSFTGGLGALQLEAQLKNSQQIKIGENVDVLLNVTGLTNLVDLKSPALQCQPGFSGFFQLSDLPPPSEIKEGTKQFTLTLRPLNSLVQAIPAITFTSFDPATAQYMTKQTQPLSLVIEHTLSPISTSFLTLPLLSLAQWPTPPLFPLELKENPILSDASKLIQTQWNLWLFPLALLGFLIGNQQLKRYQQQTPIKPQSEVLLGLAKKSQKLKFLEEALWWRLWEKKQVPQGITSLEQVFSSPFHQLLFELQKIQYTPQTSYSFAEIFKQVQQLLTKNPVVITKETNKPNELL
jgi:hypothetical protein